MHKTWNREDEKVLLRQALRCACGANRAHIKQMTSIDGTEMGVICLKCESFALGDDLAESIKNWNNRQKGY